MTRPEDNPIAPFLERQGVLVLDGGLANALEARGYELKTRLWTARLLLDAPEAITQVHMDYLEAGADCIATVSYQATLPGFRELGLSDDQAREAMRRSSSLAVQARDRFWHEAGSSGARLKPLVATSIGPYGAFLADGSEYTGDYGIGERELEAFHRERWEILVDGSTDLLAFETIPSGTETAVILKLLREEPGARGWVSFSCRDGAHLNDGTPIVDVARTCDAEAGVVAVGINCTSPGYVPSLISQARRGTGKPIFVYPNSGERYDATTGTWDEEGFPLDWGDAASEWSGLGASGIGGCCRVGPREIATVRRSLLLP